MTTSTKTQINFRADPETIRQLRELARTWGTNETGTIARCVERAYQQEGQHMNRDTREAAESRIANTPELQPYRDLLVEYDWNENGHLGWVATAPISEVVDWAQIIRQGEGEQAEAGTGYAD